MRGHICIIEHDALLAESLDVALRLAGHPTTLLRRHETHLACPPTVGVDDVVVVDLDRGLGGEEGLRLVRRLAQSGAPVLGLTASDDADLAALFVEAGVAGLLSKEHTFDELVRAIAHVDRYGTLFSPSDRSELLVRLARERHRAKDSRTPFDRLTPREQQVLCGLMDGRSAREIARGFVVSEATVRSQIRALLMKLDVHSQLAAVALAQRSGWSQDRVAS